jgi:hypothetical protein
MGVINGLADCLFGSAFKVQRKSQRVLELLHYPCGKPANLAFKTHGRQRSQSLNIGYRFTIKERKSRQRNLIQAVSPLGSERYVQDEKPRRVRVLAGDDDDGTRFGSEPQVSQPDLTGLGVHRAGRGPPVRRHAGARCQGYRDRPALSPRRCAPWPLRRSPVSTRATERLVSQPRHPRWPPTFVPSVAPSTLDDIATYSTSGTWTRQDRRFSTACHRRDPREDTATR